MKFIRPLLPALLLLLLCAGAAAASSDVSGMTLAAENGRYRLYVSLEDGDFLVENRENGQVFRAFPENWEQDRFAKGNNKKLMGSLIGLEVFNQKNVSSVVNSRAGCLEKDGFSCELTENGFDAALDFRDAGIRMHLLVELTRQGVRATVPVESIEEYGEEFRLSTIRVLPFFGAALPEDEGYILLPDGSGSLMDFDADYSLKSKLKRVVYGRDLSIDYTTLPQDGEKTLLPVFGLRRNDQAYLAIVSDGEYTCQLEAQVGGDNSACFRVSATLAYRDIQNIVLFPNTEEQRTLPIVPEQGALEGLTVDYLLLSGEDANYSGMARAYRQHLLETGQLAPRDAAPYVDVKLYGCADKNVITLGVPHKQLTAFTTFDQAIEIAQSLQDAGVEKMNLLLCGFDACGLNSRLTAKVSPAPLLGGDKGLQRLIAFAQEAGVGLTARADLVRVYQNGNGYNARVDAARNISDGPALQFTADVITGMRDYKKPTYSLLNPEQLPRRFAAYAASAREQGLSSVWVDGWGSSLYSNYAASAYKNRSQTGPIWESALDGQGVDLVADGGSRFTLSRASRLTDIPCGDSALDLTTRPVPFYQMVVHGCIPYSTDPLNARADGRDGFLRMMEYGAYPALECFHAPSSQNQFTCLSGVLSGHYETWVDQTAAEYRACAELYRQTEGSAMVCHTCLSDTLRRVDYENGASVYVNYGAEACRAEGIEIPARDYVVKGGTAR